VKDEDTYPWYLDALLQSLNSGNDALNAGVTGTSTIFQMMYYRTDGWTFLPNRVILQVTHNDFGPNVIEDELWKRYKGTPYSSSYGREYQAALPGYVWRFGDSERTFYIRNSSVQEFEEKLYYKSVLYREVSDRVMAMEPVQKALTNIGLLKTAPTKDIQQINTVFADEPEENAFRLTCGKVVEFENELASKNVRLTVFYIPRDYIAYQPKTRELTPGEKIFVSCVEDHKVDITGPEFLQTLHSLYTSVGWASHGHFLPVQNQAIAAQLFLRICEKDLADQADECQAALTKTLSFPSPLTVPKSRSIVGPENESLISSLPHEESLNASCIANVTYESDKKTTIYNALTGEKLSDGKHVSDLLNVFLRGKGPPLRFGQDWGRSRLAFNVVFSNEIALKGVVARTIPSYPNWQTTMFAVRDPETGEILNVSSDTEKRADFAVLSTKKLKRVKLEFYRNDATDAFMIGGLEFFGQALGSCT
jgi:hypothetical protein